MIIFKAARVKGGADCGRKGSVTFEIFHNEADQWGNFYPNPEGVYITVSPTANSSGELTLEYLDEVYFPEVGAVEGELTDRSGLLLDAFRGHYAQEVKDVTEPNKLLDWLMMDGGITPKAQPLDVLINKIFKGFFRDLFEEWALTAPVNKKTGHPLAPSRQLLAQWVVQAWEKVPEELIRKAWVVSGYKDVEKLQDAATSQELVEYSNEELGTIVENIAGDDAMDAWQDDANDPDPPFPEDEDSDLEDDEESESDDEEESVLKRFARAVQGSSEDEEEEDSSEEEEDGSEEEEGKSGGGTKRKLWSCLESDGDDKLADSSDSD